MNAIPADVFPLYLKTKNFHWHLRETHNVCQEHRDIATASLTEVWVDEAERRL